MVPWPKGNYFSVFLCFLLALGNIPRSRSRRSFGRSSRAMLSYVNTQERPKEEMSEQESDRPWKRGRKG